MCETTTLLAVLFGAALAVGADPRRLLDRLQPADPYADEETEQRPGERR